MAVLAFGPVSVVYWIALHRNFSLKIHLKVGYGYFLSCPFAVHKGAPLDSNTFT